jgi:hypothetical protein
MPYIQKTCPANCVSSPLYKTYFGSNSDRFTVKQDSEPYCIEVSLAGRVAYTKGSFYLNDNSDLTHWFTKEKLIAPYNATINNFGAVIENNKIWRVDLLNDTIPDYKASNVGIDLLRSKFVYPTATQSLCYSRMDASYGADGYNSRATQPINATNWFNNSSSSIAPSLSIERFYPRDRFYRVRVYKNNILIDTIVTIGCRDETQPANQGALIKLQLIFLATGLMLNQQGHRLL